VAGKVVESLGRESYWQARATTDKERDRRIASQWAVNAAIELVKANNDQPYSKDPVIALGAVEYAAGKLDEIAGKLAKKGI
jgi:hypothetical protein